MAKGRIVTKATGRPAALRLVGDELRAAVREHVAGRVDVQAQLLAHIRDWGDQPWLDKEELADHKAWRALHAAMRHAVERLEAAGPGDRAWRNEVRRKVAPLLERGLLSFPMNVRDARNPRAWCVVELAARHWPDEGDLACVYLLAYGLTEREAAIPSTVAEVVEVKRMEIHGLRSKRGA